MRGFCPSQPMATCSGGGAFVRDLQIIHMHINRKKSSANAISCRRLLVWTTPQLDLRVRLIKWSPLQLLCRARRRIIMYDDDEEEEEMYNVENSKCARMEAYTEAVRSEVLLVHALVDDQPDQVIIFKGFSSSLVRKTSADLSKPVLPSRAIIKSIDRIKGPFNPSNIEYIQKDLSWEEFQELLKAINL